MMEIKNQLASLEEEVFIIYYCFKYIYSSLFIIPLLTPFSGHACRVPR